MSPERYRAVVEGRALFPDNDVPDRTADDLEWRYGRGGWRYTLTLDVTLGWLEDGEFMVYRQLEAAGAVSYTIDAITLRGPVRDTGVMHVGGSEIVVRKGVPVMLTRLTTVPRLDLPCSDRDLALVFPELSHGPWATKDGLHHHAEITGGAL